MTTRTAKKHAAQAAAARVYLASAAGTPEGEDAAVELASAIYRADRGPFAAMRAFDRAVAAARKAGAPVHPSRK